ncbi:GntR family transcriptional regulator [Paeniglutamicibacter sp. NPDC012692]|uniref:GntR family transcriptional regulator n=1 Tax=Paeniglutamicibacter sp. NPDC012692 TaxID=3364388 RepID=UPI0036C174FE
MSTLITVDLRDATPPFEQIRAQIASLIDVGQLANGSRLPTVRALASDLGVATGTVARAYKELEAAGLIESRRRLGTVVMHSSPAADGAADSPLEAMIDELIGEARAAGIKDDTLVSLLRGRLRASG